jgi:uncharacterized protein (TIGR02687 family)
MNERIHSALDRLFEKHRIVFWYDADRELREEYEALQFPDVKKVELGDNEFGVKYRVLREDPDRKFLLYQDGPRPPDLQNWLLDVLLANVQFSTDRLSIWLSELGLGPEFRELVEEHAGFFNAASRREALQGLIEPNLSLGVMRLRMIAVCLRCDARLDAILEALFHELAEGRDAGVGQLQKYGLDHFLWERVSQQYGYAPESPQLKDFALELFRSAYEWAVHGEPRLNQEANILLQRWQNNRRNVEDFEKLSREFAELLAISEDLGQRDVTELLDVDYFREIDLRILHSLARDLAASTITPENCYKIIRKRAQGHWYAGFRDLYEALKYAATFQQKRSAVNTQVPDLETGISGYVRHWHEVDTAYRKFIHHANEAGQPTLLNELREGIENHYTNSFLLPLNNDWQLRVDELEQWKTASAPSAWAFFSNYVKPPLQRDKKIVVIISDALRYESAVELASRIRQEDRFDAEIEPMLSALPSYTQLGMAALLPHEELELLPNATIKADGKSTVGTSARDAILKAGVPGGAAAVQAKDFVRMDKHEARALFRDHSVLYVYHDRIDHTGDKRGSEGEVFRAVEQTFEDLLDVVKRLANANATNMLITSDHGFIYQDKVLDESDFLSAEPEGDEITFRHRRFVIGRGLKEQRGFKHWTAEQLGLAGELEVLVPKSINRLRLKGSGSRFVHGGATLQEVLVPVISINKKRSSDLGKVEVDLIQSTSNTITSNQLMVSLYQTEPVTDKLQPRRLHAAFYSEEGEPISNSHELVFDNTSDNSRDREQKVQFILMREADKLSGQQVSLVLQEPIEGTSQSRKYKSFSYLLRISFSSDFDF